MYLLRLAGTDGSEEAGFPTWLLMNFPRRSYRGHGHFLQMYRPLPGGGEYDISITKEKLTVNCSVHGAISTGHGNEFIETAFKRMFLRNIFYERKKSMDPEAPGTVDTPYAQKIKDALKAAASYWTKTPAGEFLKANDNEFNVFITDKNIAGMSVGDTVNAVKYVADRNGTVVAETSGKCP